MKRAVIALAFVGLVVATSCKEPTQVIVEARTNVPHRAGLATTFSVGAPGAVEKAEATTESREPWGADGFVGSLVVVPGTGDDAPLAVKLVMGIRVEARECKPPEYQGCIVARRRLRYVPHERLRLPIGIYARCEGVSCDESSTCNALGLCVSAEIDPSTCASDSGCRVPGDDAPPPVVDGDASTPNDATTDGSADANDGGAGGDATDAADAGGDAGAATPGYVECPGAPGGRCSTANDTFCCYTPGTNLGTCSTDSVGCYQGGRALIMCDDHSDCAAGETCCHNGGGTPYLGCSNSCIDIYKEVCHVSGVCQGGKACTDLAFNHYSTCQ